MVLKLIKLAGAFCLVLSTTGAISAQTSVRQSGSITPGHAVRWVSPGVIADAGTATSAFLTSIGVQNSGGPGICLSTGPNTGPYNQLCLQASTSGNAIISYNAFGGATGGGITFNINGTDSSFATVNLPVSMGDFACFANTGGTLEACGGGFSLPLPVTSGGTGLDTFAQGDLIYSSATNVLARLAKDANATRYLSNTGSSNNPAWAQIDLANGVTGTLPAANGGWDPTAWTSYTPSVSCGSGTLTSATATGKYRNVGKTTAVSITIAITTLGTCGTQIIASLPNTTQNVTILAGRETALVGLMAAGSATAAATNVGITKYDGTFLGDNGYSITVQGIYENQ